ncbi:hypothetical protein EZV62_026241 [Acer yangbiense]|uniref:Uncharacterized protein n=1 Tax=Acer yangbiense TaxID=1000413 RepID=A0A5C7GR70_9ROSI|nr:hypothetical protein EZV62_026241 [Acer yangbiense]
MDDHLIEKNNGLNGMSADDGGSSDLDGELGGTEGQVLNDVDSQMISSPTVISAAGTEGRVGGDAFIKLVRYYRVLYTGLRQRRRRTDVSYSEDDQHQETQIQNDPLQLMKRPSMTIDLNSFDQPVEKIEPPPILPRISPRISPRIINWIEQRSRDTHKDIPGGNSNDERKGWDFEWIIVITNVVLQSMSAIFTQLSSKQKPQYALFGVLVSYLALLTCIIEIIYEGHQQIQIQRGTLSNNRSQRGKSFATLNNIVALACALGKSFATSNNIVALACALAPNFAPTTTTATITEQTGSLYGEVFLAVDGIAYSNKTVDECVTLWTHGCVFKLETIPEELLDMP